ncbi:caspase family protein [Sediminitomix flava]|uniref:Caspase domain-containing protein n=1 Tax=Sediminitomix flava TaxID=379075 RepID=A0A315ZBD6_SEDFL|nr:caspase family protein [Sediminitomix flava]PWJ42896.1 caspase domain-containing protein [Sediminitomix flava]
MKSRINTTLKVLLFVGGFLFFGGNSFAQTFHAFLLASTLDPSIGSSCQQDFDRMEVEFATIANANNLEIKKYYLEGKNFSKEKLMEQLDKLECGPEDIVFFYYSGHGARSTTDASRWPQMFLSTVRLDRHYYPLEFVQEEIAKKNPKFQIVMADCCNEILPGLSHKIASRGGGSLVDDINESFDVYKNLFKMPAGKIIATSSSPGEQAFGDREGGFFTRSFLDAVQKSVMAAQPITWGDLMANTKKSTMDMCYDPYFFTPQYEIKLEEKVEEPEPEPVLASTENTVQEEIALEALSVDMTYNNEDVIENPLKDLLGILVSSDKAKSERIKLIKPTLEKVFAHENVKVTVFGRDGKTILDREPAQKFVKRLALSPNLVHLIEIRSKKDHKGRYTELDVHEYYKRQ